MRDIARSTVIAAAAVGIALSATSVCSDNALAQAKQSPTASEASAPAERPITQIALTEKQIEGVLAAQKDMAALDDKLPDSSNAEPDGKAAVEFEAVAKKAGFASYAEFNNVVDNISLVLAGFDPATKKYIGSDAVLKQQIAAVKSDTKMPSKDKKQALDDMKAALQAPAPAIENKGNIDLVGKYYDKLVGALSGDEDD